MPDLVPTESLLVAARYTRSFTGMMLKTGARADDIALAMLQEAAALLDHKFGREAIRKVLENALDAHPPLPPAGHA